MSTTNLDQQKNTARYFVEKRQVAWALLLGVLGWGVYGYLHMPQRKDPEIPVRDTLAVAQWPGMPAERVEQLVTKPVEECIARNTKVTEIRSVTKQGVAYVYATLGENVSETAKELDDIRLKLDRLQLPDGALPVELVKDFGDTATLMLTISSPDVGAAELALRQRDIVAAMRPSRTAILWPYGAAASGDALARSLQRISGWLEDEGLLKQTRSLSGSGFIGFDATTAEAPTRLRQAVERLVADRLQAAELHPDVWPPIAVRSADEVGPALAAVAGAKYSYAELDRFSEQVGKGPQTRAAGRPRYPIRSARTASGARLVAGNAWAGLEFVSTCCSKR